MLKEMTVAVLLSVPVFAQAPPPAVHFEQLDNMPKTKCRVQVPENFGCAILFDLDFTSSGNLIASIVGGFVHQLSLILDGTMYTVLYDPPLNRDDRFSGLGRNARIPARVEGDQLIIQWRDGTQAKGRIIRREQINPNQVQPA